MEDVLLDLVGFFTKPSITETFVDILLCAVPIWLAVMIGLVIGWSWRPRWTGLIFLGLRSKVRFLWTAPPGFGARRLWFAFTALSAFSVCRTIWSNFKGKGKLAPPSAQDSAASGSSAAPESSGTDIVGAISKGSKRVQDVVTETDLEHLVNLIGGRDGEMEWQSLMERSTPSMAYQAWRHDPETGPTVYCSKTIFEDATPELVRDFFWDDEFRPKWDPMLAYFKILEECPQTGTMIVHWIKKFPFFCSDREYIIGRRIWEAGKIYYCVTKGVPCPSLPKRDKPRRVEQYFSSWIIKAVESRKGDGLSACEVTLVHYEDMGIPKDVAKLGVRHGMWCTVKKLHSGMRAYQNKRKLDASPSQIALMAGITTKVSSDGSMNYLEPTSGEEEKAQIPNNIKQNDNGIDWKWVVIGGTVALVCGLHTGVIGKGLLLGAGQRFVRRG